MGHIQNHPEEWEKLHTLLKNSFMFIWSLTIVGFVCRNEIL